MNSGGDGGSGATGTTTSKRVLPNYQSLTNFPAVAPSAAPTASQQLSDIAPFPSTEYHRLKLFNLGHERMGIPSNILRPVTNVPNRDHVYHTIAVLTTLNPHRNQAMSTGRYIYEKCNQSVAAYFTDEQKSGGRGIISVRSKKDSNQVYQFSDRIIVMRQHGCKCVHSGKIMIHRQFMHLFLPPMDFL